MAAGFIRLQHTQKMFGRGKKHGLYYLLPGMTRANREKRKKILRWSLLIGVLAAGAMAVILYLIHRTPRP